MTERTIERLADEAAIRRLALDYARCADERDRDGFAALFADGALMCGSNSRGTFEYGTREQIHSIPGRLERYELTYHCVHNHYIDFDGDGASGIVYSHANHLQRGEDGTRSNLVMAITYHDRYVRSAQGWQFARREVRPIWVERKALDEAVGEIVRHPGA